MDTFEAHGIRVPHGATGNIKTTCPRCSPERRKQSDPCLSVDIERGLYHCHHCEWSGSLRGKREAPERVWRTVETKALPPKAEMYDWFSSERGISRTVVDRNRITEESRRMSDGQAHRCICFNYFVGELLVNIKYRTRTKLFSQEKGADHAFYGINDIAGEKEVIIVEGEIDKLSFEEAGFPNCVSVPDGGINLDVKNPDGKLKALDTCLDYFEGVTDIFLATDADGPGVRLREELARRLGKRRCWIVSFPDGCKDANDVLTKLGKAELATCLKDAAPYPVEGLFGVEQIGADLERVFLHGREPGATTGIVGIDNLTQWFPGQLTVWTGIPGHMKSSVCDQKNMKLTALHGWRHAYFTPEHYPLETHLQRLVEQFVGMPITEGRGSRMSLEELRQAHSFLREKVHYIQPENDNYTLDQILNLAEHLVRRHGVNNLVIDPWNHLEHQLETGESETLYVGRTLRRIKAFAREFGIGVDLIAHPTKMRSNIDGSFPAPTMYDISGSANWYNVPDNGVTIYRVFNEDYTTSHIEYYQRKVKYQWAGRPGKCELTANAYNHTFTDRYPAPTLLTGNQGDF
jgi:twinkle protein